MYFYNFDHSSLEGEVQLRSTWKCNRWGVLRHRRETTGWKQHHKEFPDPNYQTRQYGKLVHCGETKRELKRILICDCRCNERLKSKPEGSTRLASLMGHWLSAEIYDEVIKRELKRRPMYKYRCDERLKSKIEGSRRNKEWEKTNIWVSVWWKTKN
jgi:hypothetical protein